MPPVVTLETSLGQIRIQLDSERAPVSSENFLEYVRTGHYDGTIFHRVIPGFMVQGGGMLPDMKERTNRAPIRNEAGNGLKNVRGTLAMARTQVVDSATSQFFINVSDNEFLNHQNETARGYGYAVFGRVLEGMDVVDKIVSVPRGRKGFHDDVPNEPVVILSARIEEEAA